MTHVSSFVDRDALRRTLSKPVVLRCFTVSLVVGSILNAINQGDAFIDGRPVNVAKLILTYAVPYLVASFGAYSACCRLEPFDKHER